MLLRTTLAVGLLVASFASTTYAQGESTNMTIGSVAPSIEIEHWLSDGNGKFSTFNEFESDKVYVIEFWATWCGPCVMSMPHLAKTQEQYADKGVTIVSVSDEDLDTVNKFLERKVRGAQPVAAEDGEEPEVPTYADLTSVYCLTTDPDGSVKNDYFRAAGQRGIPCAFIVGKDGHVEWIGHPMAMDGPLGQVVDGTWDRDTFAEQFEAMKKFEKLFNLAAMTAQNGSFDKYDAAVAELKALNLPKDYAPRLASALKQLEGAELIGRCLHDPEKALAHLSDNSDNMSASQLGQLGSMLARSVAQGNQINEEILARVIALLETKASTEQGAGPLYGVIASLYHSQGDLDQAIAKQQKAVEASGDNPRMKRFMERALKMYQDEKAKQEEAEATEEEA